MTDHIINPSSVQCSGILVICPQNEPVYPITEIRNGQKISAVMVTSRDAWPLHTTWDTMPWIKKWLWGHVWGVCGRNVANWVWADLILICWSLWGMMKALCLLTQSINHFDVRPWSCLGRDVGPTIVTRASRGYCLASEPHVPKGVCPHHFRLTRGCGSCGGKSFVGTHAWNLQIPMRHSNPGLHLMTYGNKYF